MNLPKTLIRLLFTCLVILLALSAKAQQVEHYSDNNCDCFIYPGGNDTTKSYTPTHAQIDSAEDAMRALILSHNPPTKMHDLVRLGMDQFERHYHGTINKDGNKELRIHGVYKLNTNEVWVAYYDCRTHTIHNFSIYGSY